MKVTPEEQNTWAAEIRARLAALPIVGSCECCDIGNVRQWPTGAMECDNYRCSLMGASLSEFTKDRQAHMRVDTLQLTFDELMEYQMLGRAKRA